MVSDPLKFTNLTYPKLYMSNLLVLSQVLLYVRLIFYSCLIENEKLKENGVF